MKHRPANHARSDPPRSAGDRVQAFLDCLADLLARRWLRDQRTEPERRGRPAEPPTNNEIGD